MKAERKNWKKGDVVTVGTEENLRVVRVTEFTNVKWHSIYMLENANNERFMYHHKNGLEKLG